MLVSVFLAGPAGALVDRIETRRLVLVASLAQAGVTASAGGPRKRGRGRARAQPRRDRLPPARLGALGRDDRRVRFARLPFALVGYLIGCTGHGLKNVLVRTLMHIRVPDRLRGRTFAAYNGLRNGAELIALVGGGVLVNTISARWTLLIAGAVPAVLALVALRVGRARLLEPAAGPPAPHPIG